MVLSYIVVVIGAIYLIYYFVNAGSILNALSLNIVNLIFLILGIAFHKTPISYLLRITPARSPVLRAPASPRAAVPLIRACRGASAAR